MNSLWITIGVSAAGLGLLIAFFSRRTRIKRRVHPPRWSSREEKRNKLLHICTYLGFIVAVVGLVLAFIAWILPRQTRMDKEIHKGIVRTEQELREVKRDIKLIKEFLSIPIYTGRLLSASSAVFDPFARALKLMTEYKWDQAIIELRQSIKEARKDQLVVLYNLTGVCYYTLYRLDSALQYYDSSLTLAKKFKDKEAEAMALVNMSIILQIKGDLDKATEYYKNALDINMEIGNKELEAAALNNLGLMYQTKGNLDSARGYQYRALNIERQLGNRERQAPILSNLGTLYRIMGDLDSAKKYCEDALKIDKDINNRAGEASDLSELGTVFRFRKDFKKAIDFHSLALSVSREIRDRKSEASALNGLGIAYRFIGNLDTAEDCHKNALVICKDIGDEDGEARNLANLGLIYQIRGQKKQAISYYKNALTIFTKIGAQMEILQTKQLIQELTGHQP